MSFPIDMPAAARRHLEAADALRPRRSDVAGYLYGIAAECALKAMLLEIGINPLPASARKDDPFYRHFPELLTMVRDVLTGRKASQLHKIVQNGNLMRHWEIEMRYTRPAEISEAWVEAWAEQARQCVATIGT